MGDDKVKWQVIRSQYFICFRVFPADARTVTITANVKVRKKTGGKSPAQWKSAPPNGKRSLLQITLGGYQPFQPQPEYFIGNEPVKST